MKKVLFLAVSVFILSSCSHYTCPAYAEASEKDAGAYAYLGGPENKE